MKKFLLFGLLLCMLGAGIAQEEDVPLPKSLQSYKPRTDKAERQISFVAGGYVGAQFGTVTSVEASPHFGICPVDFLCIGVGGTYMYMRVEDYYDTYQTHVFGFNGFLEGYAWDKLVLHAEYEFLSFPWRDDARLNSHALLAGPGYQQKVSDKVYIYGLILFPVLTTEDVYSIPVIRIGFNVKF